MPSIYLLTVCGFISLLVSSLVILFTNAVINTVDDRRTVFSLLLTGCPTEIIDPVVSTISVNMVNRRFVV